MHILTDRKNPRKVSLEASWTPDSRYVLAGGEVRRKMKLQRSFLILFPVFFFVFRMDLFMFGVLRAVTKLRSSAVIQVLFAASSGTRCIRAWFHHVKTSFSGFRMCERRRFCWLLISPRHCLVSRRVIAVPRDSRTQITINYCTNTFFIYCFLMSAASSNFVFNVAVRSSIMLGRLAIINEMTFFKSGPSFAFSRTSSFD